MSAHYTCADEAQQLHEIEDVRLTMQAVFDVEGHCY